MKLRELAAFKLFDKHGISHPKIIDLTRSFDFAQDYKVVVKANIAIGGKKKAGLVQMCDFKDVKDVSKKMGVPVIVEEFIEHRDEYFVALKAVREGVEVYYSGVGGIDVEENWEQVEKVLVPEELFVHGSQFTEDFFFKLVSEKKVREWIVKLVHFFQEEDATYLEINPFTIVGEQAMPLGVVLVLDEAAEFRHGDWTTGLPDYQTTREKRVAEVDSEIKGSIKLVEVPYQNIEYRIQNADKLTAMIGGGAGAALFLCDAIVENGFKLANYAEFSGNPPNFAVTELVKEVCKIPGIKNLVIGSGIANFTPVDENIKAIIEGLRQSSQAKGLNIVVRRCGPGEEEGVELMKSFIQDTKYKIQVFGRETGMTEIVASLKTLK